ncbi:unnamed protein product [Merluccius merluccius]
MRGMLAVGGKPESILAALLHRLPQSAADAATASPRFITAQVCAVTCGDRQEQPRAASYLLSTATRLSSSGPGALLWALTEALSLLARPPATPGR